MVEGIPSGSQREAFGAAGGVLSTGFERRVHKDRINIDIQLEPQAKFKEIMVDMIASEEVSEVNPKRDKTPGEEEELIQKELKRMSDHRLASIVKKKKEEHPKKEPRGDRGRQKETEAGEAGEGEAAGTAPAAAGAQYQSSSENVAAIETDLLKDYIAMTAKLFIGKPKELFEETKTHLETIKMKLQQAGLITSNFGYLNQKALNAIKESFLQLIKNKFYKASGSPLNMADWVLNVKSGKSTMEILGMIESDALTLSDRAKLLEGFDIPDLLQITSHLNIDVDSWISGLDKNKIKIEQIGKNDIFFHLLEPSAIINKLSPIVDEYRRIQVEMFLEDGVLARMKMWLKSRKSKRKLFEYGMKKKDIADITTQSRRIAWIKTISRLKESHLNRILTTSSTEFDKISVKIEKMTAKAKKLGFDIPKEGIKWIETGLVKLAHETALYKLELLKSLQKLSFDPKRNNDILRLTHIISELEKKSAH